MVCWIVFYCIFIMLLLYSLTHFLLKEKVKKIEKNVKNNLMLKKILIIKRQKHWKPSNMNLKKQKTKKNRHTGQFIHWENKITTLDTVASTLLFSPYFIFSLKSCELCLLFILFLFYQLISQSINQNHFVSAFDIGSGYIINFKLLETNNNKHPHHIHDSLRKGN